MSSCYQYTPRTLKGSTDLLDEVSQAHRQTDEEVNLSQDPPRLLLRVLDVPSRLLQESSGIVKLRVGGVLWLRRFLVGVVHIRVIDVLDDVLLLLVLEMCRHGAGRCGSLCRLGAWACAQGRVGRELAG